MCICANVPNIFANVSEEETKNFIEGVRKDISAIYNKGVARYLSGDEEREFFKKFKEYSESTFDFYQLIDTRNQTPNKEQGVLDSLISSYRFCELIEKHGLDGNTWKEASRIKRNFTADFNKFYAKYYKSVAMFLEYIDEIFEPFVDEPEWIEEKFKVHFPNGVFGNERLYADKNGKTYYARIARSRIRSRISSVAVEKNLHKHDAIIDEKKEKYILNEVAKQLKGNKNYPCAWKIEGKYSSITSDDEIEEIEWCNDDKPSESKNPTKVEEVETLKTNKVETESKEVPSEEINNNNDKDQENETNENENNNTVENPWFFIIRNAKATEVEV